MSALPPEEQDVAARVFHYLVTPSGTKIAHTVPDLANTRNYPETTQSCGGESLRRGDPDSALGRPAIRSVGGPCYEIFHDVLVRRSWTGERGTCKLKSVTRPKSERLSKLPNDKRKPSRGQELAAATGQGAGKGARRRLRKLSVALAIASLWRYAL